MVIIIINFILSQAYVGFNGDISNMENMPAVATGNWGCGIFKGDPKLKVLLQMMAAGVSRRSVVYFTFRNEKLRDSISQMYSHLVQRDVNIGRFPIRRLALKSINNIL